MSVVHRLSPLYQQPRERAVATHPVWEKIAPRDGRGGFVRSEFNDPDSMDAGFLMLLWRARQLSRTPFRINSDARPVDGTAGADRSAHKKRPCRAVDLQVYNAFERAEVVLACVAVGICRIGIYPGKQTARGNDQAGVHADAEDHRSNPSPRIWTRY